MPNTKAVGVAYSDPLLNGAVIGTTTGTAGFYGKTPIVQPASSNQAAAVSTAPVSINATQWCFSTSTQPASIITLVNQMRSDLVAMGILKGSA